MPVGYSYAGGAEISVEKGRPHVLALCCECMCAPCHTPKYCAERKRNKGTRVPEILKANMKDSPAEVKEIVTKHFWELV